VKWEILIENETDCCLIDEETLLEAAFLATLSHQQVTFFGELSITFVDHGMMQEINYKHRGKNSTTDVLSFPQYDADELKNFTKADFIAIGDIVINIEKAREQAAEYRHSARREIAFLVVHSTLHLLGYDHETLEDEKKMFAIQEEVLTQIGLSREVQQ